jgi:hypothetical protein
VRLIPFYLTLHGLDRSESLSSSISPLLLPTPSPALRLPLHLNSTGTIPSHSIRTEDWTKAQVDFFEAFKAYDEAGSPQRIQVLKYLVLAHMLTESGIDPFDSQETKP